MNLHGALRGREAEGSPVRVGVIGAGRFGTMFLAHVHTTPGIRAAPCHDVYSAHQSVEHDDVNVLCIGAQIVGDRLAFDLLRAFLEAEHSEDEAFRRRVAKLSELEDR